MCDALTGSVTNCHPGRSVQARGSRFRTLYVRFFLVLWAIWSVFSCCMFALDLASVALAVHTWCAFLVVPGAIAGRGLVLCVRSVFVI